MKTIHTMVAGAGLFVAVSLHAAVITVTEAADDDPAVDNGLCSLREAIIAANTNSPKDGCVAGEPPPVIDIIRFDPSLDGVPVMLSIPGGGEDEALTGDLDITESVRIVGNGNISPGVFPHDFSANTLIDAQNVDRVFDIHAGAEVVMEQLAITGGQPAPPYTGPGSVSGGGIHLQGNATLSLRHVLVFGNSTPDVDALENTSLTHEGGGIRAIGGSLMLKNSALYDNLAAARGNDGAAGGGISSLGGTVTISESLIIGNKARTDPGLTSGIARGGGLLKFQGSLTITDSRIQNNSAESLVRAFGGGISIASMDEAHIERGKFRSNAALAAGNGEAFGGGLRAFFVPLTIRNSSFVFNAAVVQHGPARGGGLHIHGQDTVLNNVTIAHNSTPVLFGSSTDRRGGGVWASLDTSPPGSLRMSNSVLALNQDNGTAPDCRFGDEPITSSDHNLIGNNTGCDITNAGHDQIGTAETPINPLLSSSADNGGGFNVGIAVFPMPTQFPQDGSPLIGAGHPETGAPPLCESLDQRGFERPADGGTGGVRCDIGAVEVNARAPDELFRDRFHLDD